MTRATPPLHASSYRPDIDGLRALAVLSVVFYHAYPRTLPGGFVGVDVFFVISGFLITGLLLERLRQGRYSIIDFYQRRILRIFPVLILVLGACLAYGAFTLLASEYAQLGTLAAGGAAFVANEVLRRESGYFDMAATSKPLLHLWSLGVEEQYYIIFPPLLAFIWRRESRHVLGLLFGLACLSWALSLLDVYNNPTTAFYGLPPRFWELLSGGILAYLHRPGSSWRGLAPYLGRHAALLQSLTALLALILPCCLLNPDSLFPGFWVLLPVLSAWLFIDAGLDNPFNRSVLAHRFPVAIGLISYPLYLWHWPLLVFARQADAGRLPALLAAAMLLLAFVLAWLSYRYIELPLRRSDHRRRWSLLLLLAMSMIFAYGYYVRQQEGLPQRNIDLTNSGVEEAIGDWDYPGISFDGQHLRSNTLPGRSHDEVLFIGDSHMEQYWPRFAEDYARHPGYFTLRFATYDGCAALPGLNRPNSPNYPAGGCARVYEAAQRYASAAHVRRIVIDNYWERYEHWPGYQRATLALAQDIRAWRQRGIKVYILLSNPVGRLFVPQNQVQRLPFLPPPPESVSRLQVEKDLSAEAWIRVIAERSGAHLIDPLAILCNAERCATVDDDGDPLYKDKDHMRPSTAEEKASFIDQTIVP